MPESSCWFTPFCPKVSTLSRRSYQRAESIKVQHEGRLASLLLSRQTVRGNDKRLSQGVSDWAEAGDQERCFLAEGQDQRSATEHGGDDIWFSGVQDEQLVHAYWAQVVPDRVLCVRELLLFDAIRQILPSDAEEGVYAQQILLGRSDEAQYWAQRLPVLNVDCI